MALVDMKYMLESNMKHLRGKWQAAKTEHAAALDAKKIKFTENLGPKLDSRVTLHQAVKSFRAGGSVLIVTGQINAVKANGKAIKKAATAYRAKLAGLGNPAEAELKAVLTEVLGAADFDIAWADRKLASLKPAKKK